MASKAPVKQKPHLIPKDITAPRVTSTTAQVGEAEDVAKALRVAVKDLGVKPITSRERQKGEFTASELAIAMGRARKTADDLIRKLYLEGKYERRWTGRGYFYKKITGK